MKPRFPFHLRVASGADAERRRPAATADGLRIRLDANIEFADDLATARYAGAEGIGLYRSEFLLTGHRALPTEDQQYEIYRKMLEGMAPGPVTVTITNPILQPAATIKIAP